MNVLKPMVIACGLCMLTACSGRPAARAATDTSANASKPAMRVYIDPVTGQAGLPPAAPTSAARTQALRESVPVQPTYQTYPDGTVEMHLDRKQRIRATLDQNGHLHEAEISVSTAPVGARP